MAVSQRKPGGQSELCNSEGQIRRSERVMWDVFAPRVLTLLAREDNLAGFSKMETHLTTLMI